MQRIYLQLQRSEPLEINLEITDLLCSSSKSLIRALGARTHRWASLSFVEPEVEEHLASEFPLLLPPEVDFSALRSLEHHVALSDEVIDYGLHPSISFPSLTSLHFKSWSGLINLPGAPYSHIRTLSVTDYIGDTEELLDFLSSCPSLTTFTWRDEEDPCTVPTAPLSFSKADNLILHELIELGAAYEEPRNVFTTAIPYIMTPKLQKLSFGRAWMRDEQYADLANLVSRSGCVLSTAELVLPCWETPGEPTPGFTSLLQQLSEVEDLVLADGGIDFSRDHNLDELNLTFLRPLLPTKQSPVLLPRLKNLELVDLNFDPSLLIHLVEARSPSRLAHGAEQTDVVPLERVKVTYFAGDRGTKGQKAIAAYYRDALQIGFSTCKLQCQLVFPP